jgi:hypothetical protein
MNACPRPIRIEGMSLLWLPLPTRERMRAANQDHWMI